MRYLKLNSVSCKIISQLGISLVLCNRANDYGNVKSRKILIVVLVKFIILIIVTLMIVMIVAWIIIFRLIIITTVVGMPLTIS